MYKQHFGLQTEPFTMTPDPSLLFLTTGHREALAGLTHAILNRKGFVVLTGDPGTGKTTLLARVLQWFPANQVRVSVILNPSLTPAEFLELTLLDFGISPVPHSKAQRLVKLQQFLLGAHRVGKVAVLVVDEAQQLSPEVLEEIRLLSNFELPDTKLLQIVLAGQTELADAMNRDELRQLKQRIAVRLKIRPLAGAEIEQYMAHRWTKAGAQKSLPFNAEALASVGRYSRGIPRLVNIICDNALLLAYGEGINTVTAGHIAEVARDLELTSTNGYHVETVRGGAAPKTGTAAMPAKSGPAAYQIVAIPTLDRYAPAPKKPSLLARWMGKHRTNGAAI